MKTLPTEKFIEKCLAVHGTKYSYTNTKYLGDKVPVTIMCNIHGIFSQLPGNHMQGKGCRNCANLRISKALVMSQEQFIILASQKYNSKYDYSLVEYKTAVKKISIICPIHGQFEVIPYSHLKGHECRRCGIDKQAALHRNTLEEMLEKCKIVHGDHYDYSKFLEYKNYDTKVEIICKNHGSFFQTLSNHLNGKGCPECNIYSKSEKYISKLLRFNNIIYESQKTFPDFKNEKSGRYFRFDFFLPLRNIIIEYDGEQHFRGVPIWKDHCLSRTQNRDKLKTEYCQHHGIKLIRISYKENITKKLLAAGIISIAIPNHPLI